MPKRPEPRWIIPDGVEEPQLHLYNSLTRQKELFIPQGHVITWYSCGPTVYDDSHMGHARSYVSFDILRRVLQDYFGYPMHYVMNITDIDDKIIKRARTKYLFQQYRKTQVPWDKVYEDLAQALEHNTQMIAAATDPDKLKMMLTEVEKVKAAADAVKAAPEGEAARKQEELLACAEGMLGEWLDMQKGKEVTDNSIFAALPRHYEEEFNKDMEALNVGAAGIVV